ALASVSRGRLRKRSIGDADLEAGAARGRFVDRDAAVVVLGDPAGDREPEPGATRGRARSAPEAVEHALAVFGPDAGPGVLDCDAGRLTLGSDDDADGRTAGRVAN